MVEKRFNLVDQKQFANASGDRNPLHIDTVKARRLMFGSVAVHGIHLFLWALDNFFEKDEKKYVISNLKIDFRNVVTVNTPVKLSFQGDIIRLMCGEILAAEFKVNLAQSTLKYKHFTCVLPAPSKNEQADSFDFEQASKASGEIPLSMDCNIIRSTFPNLFRCLPAYQLGVIISTSRLVGMKCPGENSLFRGMSLNFLEDGKTGKFIRYGIASSDKRYSLINLRIEGEGFRGEIQAHVRPEPSLQPGIKRVAQFLDPQLFVGQRSLVIGGSRGLGELTVKILAAGGAEVFFTYYKGLQEAKQLSHEMSEAGLKVNFFKFDVLHPRINLSEILHDPPTHLYYFATPFIFGKSGEIFSSDRFYSFFRYYCEGFYQTLTVLKNADADHMRVYYPSTSALEEVEIKRTPLNLVEYAATKAAGETMCMYFQHAFPKFVFYYPRLGRMNTDQTATIGVPSGADNMEKVLASLIDAENHWSSKS